MVFGLIVLAVVIVAVFGFIGIYNSLIQLRNRVKNAWSQIDVQLKRRYDLIPNLVETAKGYMKHERETLEAVVDARNSAIAASETASGNPGDPSAMQGLAGAEATLAGTLGRLFALVENYPDLKANENMIQLQEELTSTENRIAFARQAFNDAITGYNTGCEKFPANMIAGAFGFAAAELLASTETPEERQAVKVSFLNGFFCTAGPVKGTNILSGYPVYNSSYIRGGCGLFCSSARFIPNR